jgi:hypothetical protein
MSGIVAIVARGDASVAMEDMERLAETYESLRGEPQQHSLAGGNRVRLVRFAGRAERPEAGVETEDGSWAAFVGRPRHRVSLLRDQLDEIDGAFALVRYDAEGDEVVVASDPHGMQMVYVMEQGSRTYVSTSALVLARHLAASPSPLDVFTYLRIGLSFGPRTHWNGIERLEPATQIRILADSHHRTTYWRSPIDQSVNRLAFEPTVNHCVEVLVETLSEDFAGARPWADLTGGFDTRLLTLGLQRAGVQFDANTAGTEQDRDVRIAEKVAVQAGWRWRRFGLPDQWGQIVPERLPHALAWGDGFLDVVQLCEVLWNHEIKSEERPSLLIGGGGEHFRNFAWQQEFLRAGRSKQVNWDNWWRMRLMPSIDASIFHRDLSGDARVETQRFMEAWIEPYADEPNTTKLDMLYAYKSTGHFGSYRSAAAAFLDAQLPFYSKAIFVAATSSDFRFRNNHRLARHMITALDSASAAIETATGSPAEPWRPLNTHRFVPYYARIGRKAVNKVAQKGLGRPLLPSGARRRPERIEAQFAALRYLEEHGGASYGDLRLGPLLNRRNFDDLMGRARNRDLSEMPLLRRIITAELALRAGEQGQRSDLPRR